METEPLYVEIPAEMKRALETLVLHYKRDRTPGAPRNLSAVVRQACDEFLRRELPDYYGKQNHDGAEHATTPDR